MKRRAKLLLPILVLAAGVALAAAIIKARPKVERQPAAAPAPLVRVVEVRLGAEYLNVRGQGTVEPRSEATLVAQVGGRIERASRRFAEGAFFSRGDTLLWIEDADYRLAVAQAEAAVAQARVGLEREEAEAELAVREWGELGECEASPLTRREPQRPDRRASRRCSTCRAPGCGPPTTGGCAASWPTSASSSARARRWPRSTPPRPPRLGCRCRGTSCRSSSSTWAAATSVTTGPW